MVMTIETIAVSKVLRVLARGDFDLQEANRTFLEVLDAIEENESEKVLFDGREICGDPTIVERFYYAEFAADSVKRSRQNPMRLGDPQFAYVLHIPILDPLRLGETVATNRGMHIKAFDNLEEAVTWLQLTPEEVRGLTDLELPNQD